MSSEEEEEVEQEQEQDQQQEQEQDQEGGDQDEDQDGGQDQDDQDQDDDQQQEQGDEDNQDQDEDADKQNQDEDKAVPSFKPISQQFTFRNLVAEIASLGNSVDHFINTLPSRGGSAYRSYQPRTQPFKAKPIELPPVQQQKKYTIMKDEDVQVSMQPQIVIQQTLAPKEQPKKQPYRISNESTKFLAHLYEQNKKLKRWQNSQTGASNGFYKSGNKFERPQHERGLINLDDRNKEIDQAIEMLRRQQQE